MNLWLVVPTDLRAQSHSGQSGDQEFLMLICRDIVQVINADTNEIASDMGVWVDRLDAYIDKEPAAV
jgi:hypothetical protein